VVDPAGRRAHDAYHRFVRDGAWAMSGLWRRSSRECSRCLRPSSPTPWLRASETPQA